MRIPPWAGLALLLAPVLRAGVVEEWNTAFEESVRVETHPPPLAARNLAILHSSMHDAFFAGGRSFSPILAGKAAEIPAANPAAAAAAAAHQVCSVLFPSRASEFDALLRRQTVGVNPADLALGRGVAAAVLDARAGDGSATTIHYVPRNQPGQWRRTTRNRPPELPQWPQVRPFVLADAACFRPSPPPAPGSPDYLAALDELRRVGGKQSAERTDYEKESAVFWSDFSYTCTPPGHWNRIARTLAAGHGFDTGQSARLFAVLNLALADAGIAMWDCKYHYNFWRPATALAQAGDPAWESLLPSPSHPEYVSGHSGFSAAAAAVLAAFLGGNEIPFSETSDALPGVKRSFARLGDAVAEIGRSRVAAGIHFPFSTRQGQILGGQVAAEVLRRYPARFQ